MKKKLNKILGLGFEDNQETLRKIRSTTEEAIKHLAFIRSSSSSIIVLSKSGKDYVLYQGEWNSNVKSFEILNPPLEKSKKIEEIIRRVENGI